MCCALYLKLKRILPTIFRYLTNSSTVFILAQVYVFKDLEKHVCSCNNLLIKTCFPVYLYFF